MSLMPQNFQVKIAITQVQFLCKWPNPALLYCSEQAETAYFK
jgi:hypothetical protein